MALWVYVLPALDDSSVLRWHVAVINHHHCLNALVHRRHKDWLFST